MQPNYAVVKRRKESPGKTFRMGVIERCPNNPLMQLCLHLHLLAALQRKLWMMYLTVGNEGPQELQNISSADSSLTPMNYDVGSVLSVTHNKGS